MSDSDRLTEVVRLIKKSVKSIKTVLRSVRDSTDYW